MASDRFDQMFKEKQTPHEMPEFRIEQETNIVDILVASGLVSSKSEARRAIEGKGVKVNEQVVDSLETMIVPTKEGIVLQKGKRHFVKIVKK